MAEHWTVAPGVEGSSPFVHPKKKGFRVKSRGANPYTLFSCAHSSAG